MKYFQIAIMTFGLVKEMVFAVEESEADGKTRHTAVISGFESMWDKLVERKPRLGKYPVGEVLEVVDAIIPGLVKMFNAVGLFTKKPKPV